MAVLRFRYAALLAAAFLFVTASAHAAEPQPVSSTTAPSATAFRTNGGDASLPWFQLQAGEFPPPNSAHHIAGELIAVDHVNRTGMIRPDRTDDQRRGEWDIARPFTMLPFGTIHYRGAPAELRDIPLGTHLHGEFYADPIVSKTAPTTFSRVFRFEDDFSYSERRGKLWRVVDMQLGPPKPGQPGAPSSSSTTVQSVAAQAAAALAGVGILTLVEVDAKGAPSLSTDAATKESKPLLFQVNAATRVWKGRGFGALSDVTAGANVIVNLTVCTLKGPGRVTDIWLDDESRSLVAAQQNEIHRQYIREHGFACQIEQVDNQAGIVTAVLFAGFDPKLLESFKPDETTTCAVAEDNLRTWDQINDRKMGQVLEVLQSPPTPGFSGVRVKFQPVNLLEGFRPKRYVRLFAPGWRCDDLPREERLYQ